MSAATLGALALPSAAKGTEPPLGLVAVGSRAEGDLCTLLATKTTPAAEINAFLHKYRGLATMVHIRDLDIDLSEGPVRIPDNVAELLVTGCRFGHADKSGMLWVSDLDYTVSNNQFYSGALPA